MSTKKLSELINPEDFKNLFHQIIVKNISSGTSFFESQKFSSLAYLPDTISFKAPKLLAANEHSLQIFIFPEKPIIDEKNFKKQSSHEHVLTLVGKVVLKQDFDREYSLYEIEITQKNEEQWKELIKAYEYRQKKINLIV